MRGCIQLQRPTATNKRLKAVLIIENKCLQNPRQFNAHVSVVGFRRMRTDRIIAICVSIVGLAAIICAVLGAA